MYSIRLMQHQFRITHAKLKTYTTYTFCIVPSRLNPAYTYIVCSPSTVSSKITHSRQGPATHDYKYCYLVPIHLQISYYNYEKMRSGCTNETIT